MNVQLFLAHAGDHEPVLPDGIPQEAVLHAPASVSAPEGSKRLISIAADADSLPEHRWAIVAPKGLIGDRLLQLVQPLRERREAEQGAEAIVYRVDPGMDPGASAAWIQGAYWDAVARREEDLPRYLLLLGGPDGVSWDLQQLLGGEAFVGRLAFPSDQGYEAYVDKVLRWEEHEEPAAFAELFLYTVRDGTRATADGYDQLMAPSLAVARDGMRRGRLRAANVAEIGGGQGPSGSGALRDHVNAMLGAAGASRPGVLFSMSHGAGAPAGGWRSADEQRAGQGAMVIGRSGERLTAADVSAKPFLPGGAWLFFACFSAGTPEHSAYYPWLDRLHRMGFRGSADPVLASLPKKGEPPFVAALPQAALANPDGPLGVIGHVDLAWTWSFVDHDLTPGATAAHGRAERFQEILRALVGGHRLGVAHYELVRFYRSVSAELLTYYGENARLGVPIDADAESVARKARRAGLWMQSQDLRAYVLLGDPAARLPVGMYPPGLLPGDKEPRGGGAERAGRTGGRDFSSMEEAVMARIRGAEAPGAIAERLAITEEELERWVSAFIDAGRVALRKLR